eukprot:s1325_g5.t1
MRRHAVAMSTFEQSLSLNELFGALICCSRGTVASKAAALFDLYSYGDPRGPHREGEHEHVVPSNKVAKIAAGQATDANAEKSRILAPFLGTTVDAPTMAPASNMG